MKTAMELRKTMEFSAAHRLLNYGGKCAHLHGHTWKVDITYHFHDYEDLPDSGMIVDFGDIKDAVRNEFDHCTLLSVNDPLVEILRSDGNIVRTFKLNPTAESIAQMIINLIPEVWHRYYAVKVDVWESDTSLASAEATFDLRNETDVRRRTDGCFSD